MPEIVSWLLAHPERWVPFAFLLASVLFGVPALVWDQRRRNAEDRRRQREVLREWLDLPTEVQAAHDEAVLDAAEAAERVVREEVYQVVHERAAGSGCPSLPD